MPLRQEFEHALALAETGGRNGRKPFLGVGIAGGAGSGKSFLANEYIQALADKGLIDAAKVQHFSYNQGATFAGQTAARIEKAFADAKGGALVIDDIDHDGSGRSQEINPCILRALDARECVVILLGTPEGLETFRRDPAVSRRMHGFITLTREDEIALQHPITPMKPLKFKTPGTPT